jgi:hypothetical protein
MMLNQEKAGGALRKAVMVAVVGCGVAGCQTKTQTGLLAGGAGGAGIGAAIGSASGNAGKGALIGGAIGLIGGGLVGGAMDAADEKEARRQKEEQARENRRYLSDEHPAGGAPAARARITQDDVVNWSRQGLSEEVIIDRIERGDVTFNLTAGDENSLASRGVSDNVIRAMKATARR